MIRKTLVWGTLLYTVGLLVVLLLSRLGVGAWWVALPNIVAPFLFLPLVLLVPLGLWVRPGTPFSRPYLLCVGVLAVVFVISFGDRFLPRSPVAGAEDDATLRVMTFNHLYVNRDLEAIKKTILRQDADLVALQELTPVVAAMVRREFRTRYPYQQLRPLDRSSTKGVGLLSRFPLSNVTYDDAYGGQHVTVQIGKRYLKLINLHLMIPFGGRGSGHALAFDPSVRARQLEKLKLAVEAAPELEGLIVVGDFNLSDREAGYRDLADLMTDAYRSTRRGFGLTFPTGRAYGGVPLPLLARLDYVWLKGLEPRSAHRDCRSGSDHCAVIADIRLP